MATGKDELYRSIDQLRRSSVSDNISEHYHKTTIKEKARFLDIAKGEIPACRQAGRKTKEPNNIEKHHKPSTQN